MALEVACQICLPVIKLIDRSMLLLMNRVLQPNLSHVSRGIDLQRPLDLSAFSIYILPVPILAASDLIQDLTLIIATFGLLFRIIYHI